MMIGNRPVSTLVVALLALIASAALSAQGYRSSNITNAFAANDISATGTPITVWTGTADDGRANITFTGGFQFPFYGAMQTNLWVCSNGWFVPGADPASTTFTPPTIVPATGVPNNGIFPLFCDLDPGQGGNVYTQQFTAPDRIVIQFQNVPHNTIANGSAQFLVIIFATGNIEVHFGSGQTLSAGTQPACGVENAAGNVGTASPLGSRVYPAAGAAFLYAPTTNATVNLAQQGTTLNFGSVQTGTQGTNQTTNISGTNLAGANISITPSAQYEVAVVAGGPFTVFPNTLTVVPNASPNHTVTSVFVRFAPTAGGTQNGTITYTTTGASTNTIVLNVTGVGVAPPPNDTVAGAITLTLNRAEAGTLVAAANDYQIQAASTKFTGLTHTVSTAVGRDVAYTFTAPAAGAYSFRTHFGGGTSNWVIYLLSASPTGTAPIIISDTDIIIAANRNTTTTSGAEELFNVTLAASQQVWLIVDDTTLTLGNTFVLEVTTCNLEAAGNDTPATAGAYVFDSEGSLNPAGDVDFFDIGTPPAGSRVFAMIDAASASTNDFDLRVTTATDTLQYDDLCADVPFGGLAPSISGTPLTGAQTYLRVNHFSGTAAEPYRLYSVVQPDASAAVAETEPNDSLAQANANPRNYFAGTLSATADVDNYGFWANVGDLVFLSLDTNPARTATAWVGRLALVDASGNVVLQVADTSTTITLTSGAGSLTATSPRSIGQGLAYRVITPGLYYARVSTTAATPGAYLLSVSKNGQTGAGASAESFNIDFGSAFGTPLAALGAAANQGGTWQNFNGITGATALPLTNMLGGSTSATITSAVTQNAFSFNNAGTSGEDEKLLDDYLDITGAPTTFTVAGLSAGIYQVYTYGWAPDSSAFITGINVNGLGVQNAGGTFTGYVQGVTHALHTVTITTGQNIVITVSVVASFATLNGIQIKRMPDPTTTPPTITSAAPSAGQIGVAYNHNFTATGNPATFTWTVTAGALPAGLTLSTAGVLSGTPTGTGGVSNFSVTVTNGISPDATQNVNLTINQPPSITSGAPAAGTVGTAYNHNFTATGFPAPTFSVFSGTLPPGLSLSGAGVLSGTPTTPGGVANFTVRASNGIGTPSDQAVNLTINEAPAFTSSAPAAGVIGSAYTHNFTAAGFPAPTFSVTSGTLPAGLTLSTAGVLSGTPTGSGGVANFTVTATNGIGTPADQIVALTINEAPTITSTAPAGGVQGVPYTHNYTASGFPASFTFTLSSGVLPTGLTLTGAGVLSGTPTVAGNYTGVVTCTNGISPDATQPFNITIAPPGPTILTSTAGPLALGTTTQGIAGTPTNYTVEGLSLTANIVITPPTGVEISLAVGGPYQTTALTLTQTGGAVAVTTIHVRIAASAAVGAVTGNITHTSTGATTQNVSVTGTMNAGIPEINVQRAASNVLDGSTDSLGSVPFGLAQTVTYTIQNLGFGALNITTTPSLVAITNLVNVTSATLTTPPATTVAGGGTNTTTFTITYTVTAAGVFSFDLSLDNNDADEGTYNWTVDGTGATIPEINVVRGVGITDGGTDSVTGATAGAALVLTYTIQNLGNSPLTITNPVTVAGQTNCTATVTTAPGASVAAAGSTTLVITVTPTAAGAFSFTVSVINDDADENPYNWTAAGTAAAKPGSKKKDGGCSTGDDQGYLFMLAGLLAVLAVALRTRKVRA